MDRARTVAGRTRLSAVRRDGARVAALDAEAVDLPRLSAPLLGDFWDAHARHQAPSPGVDAGDVPDRFLVEGDQCAEAVLPAGGRLQNRVAPLAPHPRHDGDGG